MIAKNQEIGLSRVPGLGTITTRLAGFAARVLRQRGFTTSPPKDDPVPSKLRAEAYYSIIARALTQLPSNEREAREILYDRARAALTGSLYEQNPSQIMQERHALELAIRRIEENTKICEIISQEPLRDDPATNFKSDNCYRILAHAITQLPSNEREARQALYDRARGMVASNFHERDPSLIAAEQLALEKAIRRVEANVGEGEKHRFRNPPGYQRAADTTVPSSPPRPKMSAITKVILAILAGSGIALAIAQLIDLVR